MGGWVGGWIEEKEAVRMGYCELGGVGGWVGGWVDGRTEETVSEAKVSELDVHVIFRLAQEDVFCIG